MYKSETPFINGKFLYYAFIAGGNQILKNQSELNRINIFPVNDKDTGSNLASPIRSVIDNVKPHKSYKTTVNNIADYREKSYFCCRYFSCNGYACWKWCHNHFPVI
jgi:dihydroxyacetone kinase-like predicted kinase